MNFPTQDVPQTRFTGIFIPVEILQMSELTFFEMILLSWIDALFCSKHGGCFASNEYLGSKIHNSQENTVSKALSKLRKLGLIEDVSFDGRKRVIRALIHRHVDKSHSNPELDNNPIGVGQKSNPEVDVRPGPSYIENKEESKDYISPIGDKKEKISSSLSKKSERISHGSHVKLSESEYTNLLSSLGKTQLDELISRVNDYCAAHGKTYKDYAAAIRTFSKNQKNSTQRPNNETVKESIRRKQLEEYTKTNGNFDDNPNILRF